MKYIMAATYCVIIPHKNPGEEKQYKSCLRYFYQEYDAMDETMARVIASEILRKLNKSSQRNLVLKSIHPVGSNVPLTLSLQGAVS